MAFVLHERTKAGSVGEEGPTELNTKDHSQFVDIAKDRFSASYIGKGNHAHDVGAVQANAPFPKSCHIAYFEMVVTNAGKGGCLVIGLADSKFELNRQPGWETNSYGYHAEGGRKFYDNGRGEPYAEEYTLGDIVGCGICYPKQEIFFTKNGKYLGAAFYGVTGTFYPTVGMHSPNEAVYVNFGQDPFKFDCEDLVEEYREKQLRELHDIPLRLEHSTQLIREYLLHYGYTKTLSCFEADLGETSASPFPNASVESLDDRAHLRTLILKGDIASAVTYVNEHFPDVLAESVSRKVVFFSLYRQNFVELVKQSKIPEAIAYARDNLDQYYQDPDLDTQPLADVLALLAYPDPAQSPFSHYLTSEHNEQVADTVNRQILKSQGQMTSSVIERVWRQIMAVDASLRVSNGGNGEPLQLSPTS